MALETNEMFKKILARQTGMKEFSQQELKAVQHTILEILEDISGVCEEQKLFYMLGGGTALGAFRHHGFIPWDDDADLNMFHVDLKQLAVELEKKFPGKYYMEIPGVTKGYYSTFVQIHKKGTVFLENKEQKEEEAGIKVDIFPIENTFNSGIMRKIHGMGCDMAHLLLSCYRIRVRRKELLKLSADSPKVKRVFKIKAFLGIPLMVCPELWYRFFQKWFGMCKNRKSKYVVIPSGRKHFFGELYEREAFCRTEKMDFENLRLPLTSDIHNYMCHLYGENYMVPPEEKDRETHFVYKLKV